MVAYVQEYTPLSGQPIPVLASSIIGKIFRRIDRYAVPKVPYFSPIWS